MKQFNTTQQTICFYIHHHGAGHLMRALSIAAVLQGFKIFFLGSNLRPYAGLIADEIECIHLSSDVPAENDLHFSAHPLTFLHYAPLGIAGQRERIALLTDIFKDTSPMLLIVDVSVEITLLARLCGIPSIVIRQHGRRDDLPHMNAYESAELLIAPYSAGMAPPGEKDWISAKTLYAGGFSKYSNLKDSDINEEIPDQVAVLLGQGGSSMDAEFINHLADCCENYNFHVIGLRACIETEAKHNVIWHGQLDDPITVLRYCKVVIGNAGHNTVMEMADLNKRFICIPEERPFEEQLQKAELLKANGNAMVVKSGNLNLLNWPVALDTMVRKQPNWKGVTEKTALGNIAGAISHTMERIYGKPVS
ncbi:glycosyltransferase [Pedobacter hartonius]|uniref:Predicted glycosyl transferase n=1 Tax=Pedobacter hartonius TaxID=425514 RepID=A0A1H4GK02_9SPHI|nr:glycosyltransferase [Pedobacter hartonius]SEB09837.1 Predicted glycosyl transferase [Pedobacter hartonius]